MSQCLQQPVADLFRYTLPYLLQIFGSITFISHTELIWMTTCRHQCMDSVSLLPFVSMQQSTSFALRNLNGTHAFVSVEDLHGSDTSIGHTLVQICEKREG
jgi:hypothetical protein